MIPSIPASVDDVASIIMFFGGLLLVALVNHLDGKRHSDKHSGEVDEIRFLLKREEERTDQRFSNDLRRLAEIERATQGIQEAAAQSHRQLAGSLESLSDQVLRLRRSELRRCLFERTRSREHHQDQLDAGEEYLALGGNGSGHVRLEELREAWRRREQEDDWDYTTHPSQETDTK